MREELISCDDVIVFFKFKDELREPCYLSKQLKLLTLYANLFPSGSHGFHKPIEVLIQGVLKFTFILPIELLEN